MSNFYRKKLLNFIIGGSILASPIFFNPLKELKSETYYDIGISGGDGNGSGNIYLDTDWFNNNGDCDFIFGNESCDGISSIELNIGGETYNKNDFTSFYLTGTDGINWETDLIPQLSDFNVFGNALNGWTQFKFLDNNSGLSYTFESMTPAVSITNDGTATYSINGTLEVGETLTATQDVDDTDGTTGATFTYQWQSSSDDGVTFTDITGETSSTYTVTEDYENTSIRVAISYTDDQEFSTDIETTDQDIPFYNSGDASYSVSGNTSDGDILSASLDEDDTDGNGTVSSYQWEQSTDGGSTWLSIGGETASTYQIIKNDEDSNLRLVVTYTDEQGFETTVTTEGITVDTTLTGALTANGGTTTTDLTASGTLDVTGESTLQI